MNKIKKIFRSFEQSFSLLFILKWSGICLLIGAFTGSASAVFLWTLEWATNYREANVWVIALLPIAGLVIGLSYHYYGESVVKGNNLLLDEYHSPQKIIPFKMAPLVFLGTILTHLFGGSAGREGTALQIGGAIADQFTKIFKLSNLDRKIILVAGISAGFSSVFGTPLAGAIFALEVMVIGRIKFNAMLPSFLAAVFANYFCNLWDIAHHTHYTIAAITAITPATVLWSLLAGMIFGLVSMLFSKSTDRKSVV